MSRPYPNVIEGLLEAFFTVVAQIAGEKNGRRFFPVVASIFLFLLFANWFSLLPWNNAIGQVENVRTHYLEELEENAEDLLHDLADKGVTAEELNVAFAGFYLDPLPLEPDVLDEANERIEELFDGHLSEFERAVRGEFRRDPIPAGTPAGELAEAVEERVATALDEVGLNEDALHHFEAPDAEHAVERAVVFNLPLSVLSIDESEAEGWVLNGGGAKIVPLRAETFDYDPFIEPVVLSLDGDGAIATARIYDSTVETDEENRPAQAGELTPPITVNSAHLGVFIKLEEEGLLDKTIGEIFPFFRAIATDLNLPLAIALWAFIFVQFWGIQTLGLGTNFGKFVGVGGAAVVKGPIGVFVGFLEIISEIARIVSFTFRLFGNIFAGEIVLFMAAFLVPLGIATVFYGLEVFVGFIQAFVFAMLVLVFAVTAISHGEHDEEEHGEEGAAH